MMLLALLLSAALTLAEVRTLVDDWLTPRWTAIQSAQVTYLAAHGQYFQGLATHLTVPSDGVDGVPDNVLAGPTDQAARWADLLSLPASFPCAVRIDVYDGPIGQGYQATVWVRYAGDTYARTVQVGPETWRVLAWRKLN